MKSAEEDRRRPGRPGHSKAMRYRAHVEVARQRKRQGRMVGWRLIASALKDQIPTRLVQAVLKRMKQRDRSRRRRYMDKTAEHIRVLAKDVIWTQDATHVGRFNGEAIEAQVIKDRGSLKTLALSMGDAANGEDVIMLLKVAKKEHGGLPLVWQTDNDKAYLSKEVKHFLSSERVVHLKSRIRRPTDNGAAEIGIRELKSTTGFGKGVTLKNSMEAALRLQAGARKLNRYRMRGSRDNQTAEQVAKILSKWYNQVHRKHFYEEVSIALEKAVQDIDINRARQTQREIILSALEKYNLIEWNRGGRP
jgi:transposase InsO family protein